MGYAVGACVFIIIWMTVYLLLIGVFCDFVVSFVNRQCLMCQVTIFSDVILFFRIFAGAK